MKISEYFSVFIPIDQIGVIMLGFLSVIGAGTIFVIAVSWQGVAWDVEGLWSRHLQLFAATIAVIISLYWIFASTVATSDTGMLNIVLQNPVPIWIVSTVLGMCWLYGTFHIHRRARAKLDERNR